MPEQDDPGKAFHYLVADALESLIPQVDEWARVAEGNMLDRRTVGYADGYIAGVRQMAAEVKDQLVERVLALRQ